MKPKPIALVTGATSGIGQATAYRLQDRGYLVVGAGQIQKALNTLRSRGLQARALDVTDEAAVARLGEEINTDHGGVDILVNSHVIQTAGRGVFLSRDAGSTDVSGGALICIHYAM